VGDVKGRIEIVRMEGGVIDVVIAPRKRYKKDEKNTK
jgi:hypothetical protein